MRLGQILSNRAREHVTSKVYTRGEDHSAELDVYKTIEMAKSKHPGAHHVRSMLGTLTLTGDGGDHHCLIQEPLWDSLHDLRQRADPPRFTEALLKQALVQIFQALDFLHTECKLVHTDIKGGNILLAIKDRSIFDQIVDDEIEHPCPGKTTQHSTIYSSRPFDLPKTFGHVVLSDLGKAVKGDEPRHHNAQPNVHRAPEVTLQADWSYPADIWNVGTMIRDLFEAKHLFCGRDPDGKNHTTRAHLEKIIALLGPPPRELLSRGRRVSEFFNTSGTFISDISIDETSLKASGERLEGQSKTAFLSLMQLTLQWRPEDRATARELLEDSWLRQDSR